MRIAAIGTALAIASGSILHAQQPAAINLPAAPDIAGVIKGGTRPALIATGLQGADDPIGSRALGSSSPSHAPIALYGSRATTS